MADYDFWKLASPYEGEPDDEEVCDGCGQYIEQCVCDDFEEEEE